MTDSTLLEPHFFRHEYARLVASLTRKFGAGYLEPIEDAAQSALTAAYATWTRRGLPDNPTAWLSRAAKNALIDELRKTKRLENADDIESSSDEQTHSAPAEIVYGCEIQDDELRMLFVCCDPSLAPQTQLVLSLKLLCGFSTREISARLFLQSDNVQKTLERGRIKLRELWTHDDFVRPTGAALSERTSAVLSVVYLLFNEGYSSQRTDEIIRRELCHEAIRLGERLVAHSPTATSEAFALLALMHFHGARLDARVDDDGELLMLEAQDRTRWSRHQIARAYECLYYAQNGNMRTRYHGEAAILAEHCAAASYVETRWDHIVELYEMLELIEANPLYTLNRAIALSEWKGPAAGLSLLAETTPPGWLIRYYLWDSAWGELLRRDRQFERACRHLQRAIENAPTDAERRLLGRRLVRCQAHDSER